MCLTKNFKYPKMQVLNLIRLFFWRGVCLLFTYISRIHTAYTTFILGILEMDVSKNGGTPKTPQNDHL